MRSWLAMIGAMGIMGCSPSPPSPPSPVAHADAATLLRRIGMETLERLEHERVRIFDGSQFLTASDDGAGDSLDRCHLTPSERAALARSTAPRGFAYACLDRTAGGLLAVGDKVLERGNCDDRSGTTSFVLVLLHDDMVHTLGKTSASGPSGCPCPTLPARPFEVRRADVDGDGLTDLVIGKNEPTSEHTLLLVLGKKGSRVATEAHVRDGAIVERLGPRIIERHEEETAEATFRVLGAAGFVTDPLLEGELRQADREMSAARTLAHVSVADVDSEQTRAARLVLGL